MFVVSGPVATLDCGTGVQEAVQGQGRCGLGEARRDGPEEGYVADLVGHLRLFVSTICV